MKDINYFIGVIEDINDPLQMNRVRVRCFEYHTDDKTLIDTSDLPWGQVMMPTNSASVSGIGLMPHGLKTGSWVIGVFLDPNLQAPLVLGTIASMHNDFPNFDLGFSDPTRTYPKAAYMKEPDVNKLARGEDTITYTPDSVTGEPASPYAAEYPYNSVLETEGGNVLEIDDTPGAERIRIKHSSGTIMEMHPNGDIVQRNNNKWSITTGNDKAHITGNIELHIDSNAEITVNGNTTLTCSDTTVTGNVSVGGNLAVTGNISGSSNLNVSGTIDSGSVSLESHTHAFTGDEGFSGTTQKP